MTVAAIVSTAPAIAQVPPISPAPTAQAQAGCPPRSATMTPPGPTEPGVTTGRSTDGDTKQEPLGDKLARSDGVLCPPSGVDPEIRAPTPEVGNTPVIPPPGSPGGDPTVRPK
jgi:hypothetical protein